MSHVAMVRSSSRMSHQNVSESQSSDKQAATEEATDRLSQLSIISITSTEGGDLTQEVSLRQSTPTHGAGSSSASKRIAPIRPITAPLDQLHSIADIEACVDDNLHQAHVIQALEDKWLDITLNFNTVLDHLQECSSQVSAASNNCLQSLVDSIENTCDKADTEVKALYHLMTKCDELTTKLSIATSLRDEVKTLRKAVETLESVYKAWDKVM